jgi:hypothetical protein
VIRGPDWFKFTLRSQHYLILSSKEKMELEDAEEKLWRNKMEVERKEVVLEATSAILVSIGSQSTQIR